MSATFERRLTRDWDDAAVIGIDGYRAKGGYEALKNVLNMEPAAIIDTVKASGLRGRGGAGFPTGMKWSFVPMNTGKPTYVVVNFDESEPGTVLAESDRILVMSKGKITKEFSNERVSKDLLMEYA